MPRICVTGANGHLGSRVCNELLKRGHDVISVDMVKKGDTIGEFRQADLSKAEAAEEALRGAEILMHCAAIHPWKQYTEDQYLDLNVKATWRVFQAALALDIERVVLTSSIAACGYDPPPELQPVDESFVHPSPNDLYSLTKLAQEQIARHFAGRKDMKVVALRPPNFTPKPPVETGAALLTGCAVVEDVASAHIKALDVWEGLENNFEPFFITQSFPYSAEEVAELSTDPRAVLDRYFPGAWDWFHGRGMTLQPSPMRYDNTKAKRLLNWQPELTFARWWEERRSR